MVGFLKLRRQCGVSHNEPCAPHPGRPHVPPGNEPVCTASGKTARAAERQARVPRSCWPCVLEPGAELLSSPAREATAMKSPRTATKTQLSQKEKAKKWNVILVRKNLVADRSVGSGVSRTFKHFGCLVYMSPHTPIPSVARPPCVCSPPADLLVSRSHRAGVETQPSLRPTG